MFSKTPEHRRKYLNMVLAQKEPRYLESLGQYKKILFQKNRLLQDIKAGRATAEGLDSWNEQLVAVGSYIIQERKKFVNYLNTSIADIYTTISGFHRPVEVVYESVPGEAQEEIAEGLRAKLSEAANREALLSSCLVGPHRDDFFLISDGLYLSPFSSAESCAARSWL